MRSTELSSDPGTAKKRARSRQFVAHAAHSKLRCRHAQHGDRALLVSEFLSVTSHSSNEGPLFEKNRQLAAAERHTCLTPALAYTLYQTWLASVVRFSLDLKVTSEAEPDQATLRLRDCDAAGQDAGAVLRMMDDRGDWKIIVD